MPSGNPSEWQENDLLALIRDQVEESLELEYKASPSLENTDGKKNEISKDVSSFANSAGGTIVYGITESADHLPVALDGQLDPSTTNKEWLEQVIHGRIRPRLNVHINPVTLTTQHPGRVAYVVSIPQSMTAHQASDKRYYKRFNFTSVPMEDHEIRDVMNRLKFPLLVPTFTSRLIDQKQTTLEYALDINIANNGPMAAHEWKIVLSIPVPLSVKVLGFGKQKQIEIDSRIYGNRWFVQGYQSGQIIFPEDDLAISKMDFVYKIDTALLDRNESREPFLYWTMYADNMPPQKGQVFLASLQT